jgi:organic radical activating enzyme
MRWISNMYDAWSKRPILETLRRVTDRFTYGLAGGWYTEHVYYRCGLHLKAPVVATLYGLGLLPVALTRRAFMAGLRRFELTRVEVAVTTRCSLNCRDCANLIPFYSAPADFDVAELIRSIDDFLGLVDRVHSFSIMGGEACLHPGLAKVLAHLVQQRKIDTVQLATNGTIVPNEEVLQVLAHRKVVVSVSDYPAHVARNKNNLLAKLRERRINLAFRSGWQWRDFGGFAPEVDASEAALDRRFQQCMEKKYHNLIDGKFHLCPRSAHGSRIGQFPVDPSDSVNCRGRQDRAQARAELRQLLGRTKSIAACAKCKGGTEILPPAIQMPWRSHSGVAKAA